MENEKGRRHFDKVDKSKINGFFTDEGFLINTDLIKKPSLYFIFKNDNDPEEEILCTLTHNDQRNASEFNCFAFKPRCSTY